MLYSISKHEVTSKYRLTATRGSRSKNESLNLFWNDKNSLSVFHIPHGQIYGYFWPFFPLGSLLLNIILVNKVYVIKLLANPNPLTVHLVYGCPLMTFFDKVMQLSTWANHWMYRHLNRFTHSAMNFETILFPIFQNAKVKIVICEKDQIHAKLFLNFNFLRSVRF